jgi:hypothetical protein
MLRLHHKEETEVRKKEVRLSRLYHACKIDSFLLHRCVHAWQLPYTYH